VHVCFNGEGALLVASQHVERGAGDEVVVCIQWNVVGAVAFVGEFAVQRIRGGGEGFVEGYGYLKPD